MVEAAGRSAAAREQAKKLTTSTTSTTMKKKKLAAATKPSKEKEEKVEKEKSSSKEKLEAGSSSSKKHPVTTAAAEPAGGSPSYRLALRSIFSCRNSHGHHPAADTAGNKKQQQQLGCSSTSICKHKDTSPRHRAEDGGGGAEPCKRRASVSGDRLVKKKPPLKLSEVAAAPRHGNGNGRSLSSASSSSSTAGGSSFRASMQLRRLSGCYECHMVVDPISGVFRDSSSMRVVFSCPDCGEIFVRAESLHLHQSIRHAVSELGPEDTSRNIIEIIFQSSWLKKQSPVCVVDRILKVHNAPGTLARFEDHRDAVKARASTLLAAKRHPRCTADGNELLRFHCATLACSLGLGGATSLCDAPSCAACGIIRDGFRTAAGVRTMATSGRAHDALEEEDGGGERRRAMLVCRVIAGRVKRAQETAPSESEEEYDSVAGSAGVYSNLDELEVFNPRAILPCFVVVYKA